MEKIHSLLLLLLFSFKQIFVTIYCYMQILQPALLVFCPVNQKGISRDPHPF